MYGAPQGNYLLMGTPNSVIQPLQKIENFAARLILLAPCHQHLFWKNCTGFPFQNVLSIKSLAIWCFNDNVINGSGPDYLLNCYMTTLCSCSDTHMLKIQQHKCNTHGFRTFSCFGPHIWNSLTQDLRHCSTQTPNTGLRHPSFNHCHI